MKIELIPHSLARNCFDWFMDVRRAVLAEPKRIRMENWISAPSEETLAGISSYCEQYPECGAQGCIGGWLKITLASKDLLEQIAAGKDIEPTMHWAAKRLPQDPEFQKDLEKLFLGTGFPAPYPWPSYYLSNGERKSQRQYADEVVANIDKFTTKWERLLKATEVRA